MANLEGAVALVTDSDIASDIRLNDVISEAIKSVFDEENTPKKQNPRPSRSGKLVTEGEKAKMAELVSNVISAIQPLIIKTVTSAVAATTKILLNDVKAEMAKKDQESEAARKDFLNKTMKIAVHQQSELDRQEQYSRKENLKIYGMAENENEDTTEIIIQMANEIGVPITRED